MNGPKLLTAEVTVDDQTFTGSGPSRAIAKNIAAEAAVHFVVMQKNKELPPEDGGRFQDSTPWGALASLGRLGEGGLKLLLCLCVFSSVQDVQ